MHVQGTRLGEAHSDIEHVVHLVEPRQRVDALVNLLLSDEEAKSLVFARTRADVARIAGELAEAGFVVRTLSGEMEQPERDRALAAFRQGGVQALVATDVAARGIDVRDIARVIQVEPPTDVETYTHRSGRTGRAGKQGTSVLFVAPSHYPAIARGLARAKIAHRVEPIPRPEAIQRAREEKLVAWLAREGDGETIDPHAMSIAERIVKSPAPLNGAGAARREGRAARPDEGARRAQHPRASRGVSGPVGAPRGPARARTSRGASRLLTTGRRLRVERHALGATGPRPTSTRHGTSAPVRRDTRDRRGPPPGPETWVSFRVTWGGQQGADARRLLAVACRRGNIRGSDVGAIRVEDSQSFIDVARDVADAFEAEAARPDPRDPRVRITRADSTSRPTPSETKRHRPEGPRRHETRPRHDARPRHEAAPRHEAPPRREASPRQEAPPRRVVTHEGHAPLRRPKRKT